MNRRWPVLFAPLAAILCAAVLASCATLPGEQSSPDIVPDVAWQGRKLRLQEMQAWDFSGRISATGPEGSWSARIHWAQAGDAYDIHFSSLFGQRIAMLEGDRSGVMLQLPEGEPLRAPAAEELLETTFGWSAPVAALRYWILGVPQPEADAVTRLDAQGRLARLEQEGWQVEYPQYVAVGAAGGDLPRKITLNGAPARIRLVVDRWNVGE